MRYHYELPKYTSSLYGELYFCNHPVYKQATLYRIGDKGLCVIQQYFDEKTKASWWGPIDALIVDSLYLHPKFKLYFDSKGARPTNGMYPTVSLRQIMWALRMKPIPRKRWETYFDRPFV